MSAYSAFSACKETYDTIISSFDKLSKQSLNLLTEAYVPKIIKQIWQFKNAEPLANLELIEKIINTCIVDGNKINKIRLDIYKTSTITHATIPPELKTIMYNAGFSKDSLRFYEANKDLNLPNSLLLLLTTKIQPIHFYLDTTLTEAYHSMFQFAKLLDCFIEIYNAPKFFEEYCTNIGLMGLQIIDIEIILGLLTNLLLIDSATELQNEYNDKGKINKLNNIFDLIFKWKHIDGNALFTDNVMTPLKKYFKDKIDMDPIFNILLNAIDKKMRPECKKLYDLGKMSISVYIAYFIRTIKPNIPVLSFSNLGYLDDLVDLVIKNAHTHNHNQHGGFIVETIGTFSLLQNSGLIKILSMVGSLIKRPILSCVRTIYKDNIIDISMNLSFEQLYNKYKNDGDTIIINIVNQQKYHYLASLILSFKFNTDITIADKQLISNVCNASRAITQFKRQKPQKVMTITAQEIDFKFKSLSYVYDVALPLIAMPTIFETGVLGIDMMYILFSEKKSIFKIYDKFISSFFKCDEYKIEHEFEYLSKLIINFLNNLSARSTVIIRKKIISFILVQNLYLLHSKYSLTADAENRSEHIGMVIDICKVIVNIIETQDYDMLNELILACLGIPNTLLGVSKTMFLNKLVNYNFIEYRKYVALIEIVTVQKAILFDKLTMNYIRIREEKDKEKKEKQEKDKQEKEKQENNILTIHGPEIKVEGWSKSVMNWFTNFMKSSPAEVIVESTETIIDELGKIKTDTKINVDDTIKESVDAIHDIMSHMTLKDSITVNKQKLELFFLKLFEYNLYVSLPIIENKLQFTIVNNILHCDEIDKILVHLTSNDTNLLFETTKQKEKIKFLGYY